MHAPLMKRLFVGILFAGILGGLIALALVLSLGRDGRVAACVFQEIGERAGVDFHHYRDARYFNLGGGTAAGDFNNDGLVDIYAVNSNGANALYRNDGDGTFTDVAREAGVAGPIPSGNGAGWADYDNDGDLDLFVAAFGASRLFRNEGSPDFRFEDVTEDAGVTDPGRASYRTMGVAWGDYDMDGFLDLLVVRHFSEHDLNPFFLSRDFTDLARPLALYHNRGDGTFANVTFLLGDLRRATTASFKPVFVDYDGDGDPDIYTVNDFGQDSVPNVLWRNDGPDDSGRWTFTDVSAQSGANLASFLMGLAVGDYDADGDLDFFVTDMGPNHLLRNEGNGTFTDQAAGAGVTRATVPGVDGKDINVAWGAAFFDCNNDGWLDIYMTAGFLDNEPFTNSPRQSNALFLNRGDGTFEDISSASGADDAGVGRDIAVADFDNDGLLDIFVINLGDKAGDPGIARLLRNVSADDQRWLSVKTIGTTSSRDGAGARITVSARGQTQTQEVASSQSHISHHLVPAHFGLGGAAVVESLEIRWPSGKVQRLQNVPTNQVVTLVEP